MRAGLIWVLAAQIAFLALSPVIEAQESLEPPAAQTGERDVLRRAMLEQRIESEKPRPGLTLYLRDVSVATSRWIDSLLERLRPRFARLFGPMTEPLLDLLLFLLVSSLAAFAGVWAWRRWQARVGAEATPDFQALPSLRATAADSAHDWRAELERRLDADDAMGAIEALWWWLANRLVGDRAEASWTSRELIQRAGRRDLRPPVRRLDSMIYGYRRPRTPDVRELWQDLQEAVG